MSVRMVSSTGLIPARAGTTLPHAVESLARWAHPRSRGDHIKRPTAHQAEKGSSPLARGPPMRRVTIIRSSGLIPARAGTTAPLNLPFSRVRAHPRSRGDHFANFAPNSMRAGSSPLARGPPDLRPNAQALAGLIPARAGTTCRAGVNTRPCWAHPRSRGDHPLRSLRLMSRTGSSPLARGPPVKVTDLATGKGLIPARAGTTMMRAPMLSHSRAHPRSRGDHFAACELSLLVQGSSPLARGPHEESSGDFVGGGLIPARAGTTCLTGRGWSRNRAHPRSRGDHF